MKNEIAEIVSELFRTVIQVTKTTDNLWINIKELINNEEIFTLIEEYQRERLLENEVLCSEKSFFMNLKSTYYFCLCFKNLVSNEKIYKFLLTNSIPLQLFSCSEYDNENFSSRLGNLIRFKTMKPEDIEKVNDVEFIKAIIAELQDT